MIFTVTFNYFAACIMYYETKPLLTHFTGMMGLYPIQTTTVPYDS